MNPYQIGSIGPSGAHTVQAVIGSGRLRGRSSSTGLSEECPSTLVGLSAGYALARGTGQRGGTSVQAGGVTMFQNLVKKCGGLRDLSPVAAGFGRVAGPLAPPRSRWDRALGTGQCGGGLGPLV